VFCCGTSLFVTLQAFSSYCKLTHCLYLYRHFQLLQIHLFVLISRVSWIMLFPSSQLSFVRWQFTFMNIYWPCFDLFFPLNNISFGNKLQDYTLVISSLWQANRALRQATLGTLNSLVVTYGGQIGSSSYETIIAELSTLIRFAF
jgi:hypothetical protein